ASGLAGPAADLRESWFRRVLLRRRMSGVFQGVLGGGRALLVGWFVPSLINLLVFGFVIVPQASGFQALAGPGGSEAAARSTIFALVGTTVAGLVLAAPQTQIG